MSQRSTYSTREGSIDGSSIHDSSVASFHSSSTGVSLRWSKERTSHKRQNSSRNNSPIPASLSDSLSLGGSQLSSLFGDDVMQETHDESSSSLAVDSTPFLTSVWNLFKDAKDVATKEFDRLLERFPYRNTKPDVRAVGRTGKRQEPLSTTSLSSSRQRLYKSRLGYGSVPKYREVEASRKRGHLIAGHLDDEDFWSQLNNRTPTNRTNLSGLTSRTIMAQEDHIAQQQRRHRHQRSSAHHSSVLVQSQEPPTDPLQTGEHRSLSRWSGGRFALPTEHANRDSDSIESSSDFDRKEDQDTDGYPSDAVRSRGRHSRESSTTPSLINMAGGLSLASPRASWNPRSSLHTTVHESHHRHRSHNRSRRRQTSSLSQLSNNRYSLSEIDSDQYLPLDESQGFREDSYVRNGSSGPSLSSLYPQHSHSQRGSLSGIEQSSRPQSMPSYAELTPSSINSLPSHQLQSSLPPSPPSAQERPWSSQSTRPISPTVVESEKLDELKQELAAIKQQLASLVSAREGEIFRAQSALGYNGSPSHGIPPPPPPPPMTQSSLHCTPIPLTPKRWSMGESEVSRSMNNVLKELSTSKLQLRKTGSPLISGLTSAVDSSSSSKYTMVAMKSRQETQKALNDNTPHPGSSRFSRRENNRRAPSPISPSVRSENSAREMVELSLRNGVAGQAKSGLESQDTSKSGATPQVTLRVGERLQAVSQGKRKLSTSSTKSHTDLEIDTMITTSRTTLPSPTALVPSPLADIPRSGPILESPLKKQRPARPRSASLIRSMTDPLQLSSYQHGAVENGNKDQERKWFKESDMDGWRVGL